MRFQRFLGALALVACLALGAGCAQKSSDEKHGASEKSAAKESPAPVAETGQATGGGEVQLHAGDPDPGPALCDRSNGGIGFRLQVTGYRL